MNPLFNKSPKFSISTLNRFTIEFLNRNAPWIKGIFSNLSKDPLILTFSKVTWLFSELAINSTSVDP